MNKTIILTKENIDHVLGFMHTILVGTKTIINSHNFPEASIEDIVDILKISFLETGDTEKTIYLKVVWEDGWCTIDTGVAINFNSHVNEFKFISGTDMTTIKLIYKETPIMLDKNNIEAIASYLTFNMVGNTYEESLAKVNDNTVNDTFRSAIITTISNTNKDIVIRLRYSETSSMNFIIELGAIMHISNLNTIAIQPVKSDIVIKLSKLVKEVRKDILRAGMDISKELTLLKELLNDKTICIITPCNTSSHIVKCVSGIYRAPDTDRMLGVCIFLNNRDNIIMMYDGSDYVIDNNIIYFITNGISARIIIKENSEDIIDIDEDRKLAEQLKSLEEKR